MALSGPGMGVRQAEILACLSLAIDLGFGLPAEWMQTSAVAGVRLAAAAGLSPEVQRTTYFLSLISHIGCTTTALNDAMAMGDERDQIGLFMANYDDGREIMRILARDVGRGLPLVERARTLGRFVTFMVGGGRQTNHSNHCEGGEILATRLGLGPEVGRAMWHVYEYWNGKGGPNGLSGTDIDIAARVMHIASTAAHFHAEGGPELAAEVIRQRSGGMFDPDLCRVLLDDPAIVRLPDGRSAFAAALEAEPGTKRLLAGPDLRLALEAIADFVDQKTPATLGHSRRVADLAAMAAQHAGLPAADAEFLRQAGLIHDTGRVGVSARLLVKTGPLTTAEWEKIRLHPYLTERVFAASPSFAPVARLAACHHERLDGSGYHRGLLAPELAASARILAAANAYAALTEVRPHRPKHTPAEAARALLAAVQAGQHDRRTADAVLAAAGEPVATRRGSAVALSDREVEVLRLVARQHTNKSIARALGISPKTVEHHVSHIFDKTGCTTRTGAALFATHNQLF